MMKRTPMRLSELLINNDDLSLPFALGEPARTQAPPSQLPVSLMLRIKTPTEATVRTPELQRRSCSQRTQNNIGLFSSDREPVLSLIVPLAYYAITLIKLKSKGIFNEN